MRMIHLGINIDHVATIRQARLANEPDPIQAAVLAELGGAQGITVHLRGDRRHIQIRDVVLLKQTVTDSLNLELALEEDVLELALELQPQYVCMVPEKREELTTEGGLALDTDNQKMKDAIQALQENGTVVSLFIDPDIQTIDTAKELGATCVELHTGTWANAWIAAHEKHQPELQQELLNQLQLLEKAADHCANVGIRCHAGHGITYQNVRELLHLTELRELNIGHTIVSKAVMVGMERAVREMRALMDAGPA